MLLPLVAHFEDEVDAALLVGDAPGVELEVGVAVEHREQVGHDGGLARVEHRELAGDEDVPARAAEVPVEVGGGARLRAKWRVPSDIASRYSSSARRIVSSAASRSTGDMRAQVASSGATMRGSSHTRSGAAGLVGGGGHGARVSLGGWAHQRPTSSRDWRPGVREDDRAIVFRRPRRRGR